MVNFRSTLEEELAIDLERRGVSYEYESLKVPYTLERVYKPDFILPNGICVEAKGWHRNFGAALRKLRTVKSQHPELDIRIVWSRLCMKATKSYTAQEWCEAYGFKYAERTVPQEWIDEPPKETTK